MKKCIYSVITDNYDALPYAPKFDGWDSIMFTDEYVENTLGWTIIKMVKKRDLVLQSRDIKILSHRFLL